MSTRQDTCTVRRVHAYHCSPYTPTHAKHTTHATHATHHTQRTCRYVTHSSHACTQHTHIPRTLVGAHVQNPRAQYGPRSRHLRAPPPATGGPWHSPSPSSLTPPPWGTRWTAVASPRQKREGTSTCFSRDRDLEAFTCANTSALQVCIARHL